jgi:hypothetical protein
MVMSLAALPIVIPDSLDNIGIWIAAFLTICIYSFLYKDNPLYKFAEYLFVGVSAGYWVAMQYYNSLKPNLIDNLSLGFRNMDSHLLYIIPGILGIMMLLRLVPSVAWLSRWSISFVVGMSAGINLIAYLQGNAIAQVKGSMVPLWVVSPDGNILMSLWLSFGNWILVGGVCCGLIYFFFSVEHRGVIGGISRAGIYFLMISFGASFGYTIMARISLLIGRMQFLFGDWILLIR